MSGFHKTLLSCAISMAVLANADTGNSFIDDTRLGGRLRTTYYDIENTYDKDQDEDYYRTGAWTGGLQLNLQSGYLYNALAVGGSFYGATKLGTLSNNDPEGSSPYYQLLRVDGEGFAKIGQAWVDLKLGQEQGFFGDIRVGRQQLYNGLISSSGSRTIPSTWEGVNINAEVGDLSFGLGWVNRMSLRDEDEFRSLEDFNGNKIDYIVGGQLAYTFRFANDSSLTLKYRNAFSKDFLQGHNGDVLWKMPLGEDRSLALGAKYYQTEKDGELWDRYAWWAPAFDDKATAYNLNATLNVSNWSFRAAASQIESEFTNYNPDDFNNGYAPPGKYYYDYGQNTHGIWDLPTSSFAEDMMYDGELVWMLGVEYDFSMLGVKGLKAGYAFHYGSGMEVTEMITRARIDVSEQGHDFHVTYAFPQEPLKGLKFKLEYGIYRNDKELREALGKEENDLRVWLDYDFKCF